MLLEPVASIGALVAGFKLEKSTLVEAVALLGKYEFSSVHFNYSTINCIGASGRLLELHCPSDRMGHATLSFRDERVVLAGSRLEIKYFWA